MNERQGVDAKDGQSDVERQGARKCALLVFLSALVFVFALSVWKTFCLYANTRELPRRTMMVELQELADLATYVDRRQKTNHYEEIRVAALDLRRMFLSSVPVGAPTVKSRLADLDRRFRVLGDEREIAGQLRFLQALNEDFGHAHSRPYEGSWIGQAFDGGWLPLGASFVIFGGLFSITVLPIYLSEVRGERRLENRLRARARRLDFLSFVMFGGAVLALIIGAIAFVQVGTLVASDYAVAGESLGIEPTNLELFKDITNIEDERPNEYMEWVAEEASERGIPEDEIEKWKQLTTAVIAAEKAYERSPPEQKDPAWSVVTQAREARSRFLNTTPKLEDVQYTVGSHRRAPGWLWADARLYSGPASSGPAAGHGEPAATPGDGEERKRGGEVTISAFNWQVNLTRLGITVFTLFLVQMLLSLQRYITRLSSFYSGRADAIQHYLEIVAAGQWSTSSLSAAQLALPGFSVTPGSPEDPPSAMQRRIELMEALTPGIPYGRPSSPDKSVVEMTKVVAGRQGAS